MSTTDRDAAMISQQGTEPILQFFAFDHPAAFGTCRRVRATVAIDQPRQQLSRESCLTTRDPKASWPLIMAAALQ